MFKVKKIRFKNFRSYGNQFTELELDNHRAVLITAPNGSGKSSILMAIEFALFGKAYGINKPDLVNVINQKELIVELECETKGTEIVIRRGVKPNFFEIYLNGSLVNQDSVKDYQSYLEDEILGFNLMSFRQIVSINGSTYTPFLLLPAGQRRKVIEDLLDLNIFSRMSILHAAQIAQHKEDLQYVENTIQQLKASVESLKKGLASLSEQEESYKNIARKNIDEAQQKIATIKAEIEQFNKQIQQLQEQTKSYQAEIAKREELKRYERDIEKKIQKIINFVQFLQDNDICPTCTQSIDEHFKSTITQQKNAKQTELQSSLEKLNAYLSKVEEKIKALEDVLKSIHALEKNVFLNTKRISDLQEYIMQQQKILTKPSIATNDFESEIAKLEKEIETYQEKRIELIKENQYNQIISSILKDNGIKARIIAQYIPAMNQWINHFLENLDLEVLIEINENFEEKIFSRFRDELSYASFSAGEKARIDIAFLFSWRELAKLRNALNCNLLFIDEIFDSALDEQGLDAFINLLKYNLEGTNVFLISHRYETLDKFENVIKITKSGNFSRIEA